MITTNIAITTIHRDANFLSAHISESFYRVFIVKINALHKIIIAFRMYCNLYNTLNIKIIVIHC